MMKLERIKEELDNCENPLFIFDDDQDGLSAFLMLRKYKGCGKYCIVKTSPKLNKFFADLANNYNPDKIFVLDVAKIDQDFFDEIKVPIIWIDHHNPEKDLPSNCIYINPRIKEPDSYFPTSYLVYNALKKFPLIGIIGCISDAMVPDFISKVPKELLNKKKDVWDIRFNSPLGKLCSIFSFVMKGSTAKVSKCVNALINLEDPADLLKPTNQYSKFILKHVEEIQNVYDELKEGSLNIEPRGKLFIYIYKNEKYSLTKELANEISYMHPDKITIVGRDKSGSTKVSIRSKKIPISPIIEKIFSTDEVKGYGGGHLLACGSVIESEDFDRFLELFEKYISLSNLP